jgi:hypothetical protein
MYQRNYSNIEFVQLVVYAGLIEAAFSLSALVSPGIKGFLINWMNRFSGGGNSNTWYTTVRSYGFAISLTDLFGLAMGMIAGISFFYGFNYKKRYLLYSVLIMVAGTLSARTTIVIYAIALILTLFYGLSKVSLKFLCRIIVIAVAMAIVSVKMLRYMETNVTPTTKWIMRGINDIVAIISNNSAESSGKGFAEHLTSKSWWELPDGLFRLVFGTGHSRYGAEGYVHSDIGYVNDIWFVGLLGMLILYGSVVYINLKIYKKAKLEIQKFISLFTIISFLTFNIKGCALGYNPGPAVMFVNMFVASYYSNIGRNNITFCKRLA